MALFDKLSDSIALGLKKLKGEGKITEINISVALKDVRRALTEADVEFSVANNFIKTVKQKALGQNVLTAVKPGEMMIKIVHDELATLMGGTNVGLNLNGKPAIILMAGLQGSGKTTFSGKLARKLKSEKAMRPLLVACDVYRPAAIDQLKVLAEKIEVPVYTEEGSKDPVSIARNAIEYAKANHHNLVIIDTAGRLAIDEEMMTEIENIKKAVKPTEILFVIDSMIGQSAVVTAKTFNERLDFDGVVLTKLDGDARGGAALSVRAVVEKPIKFVSTSESLEGIDAFHPERMADRILGMGDIVSLVERAQQQISEDEAKKIAEKMRRNQFNYEDFLEQIQKVKKMGNIKDLASMIPGLGKALRDVDIDNDSFKSVEAMIGSMTKAERQEPRLLNETSRRRRIAAGSGTTIQEVNRLVKQFEDMRQMMKQATSKNPAKLMAQARQMRKQMKMRR